MIIKFYKNDKVEQECKPLFSFFPDGQPHVKVQTLKWDGWDKVEIHCSIRNPLEQFQWMMVWDVINAHYHDGDIENVIYWLYGARMDRPIDDNQPGTFRIVVCSIPPTMFLSKISVLDLHNPKTFPGALQVPLKPVIDKVLADFGDCDIYFPDKGAQDRYKNLFPGYNILCGKKKRDSQTGKLSGFELESGERKNERILVVDDICAGGYTFFGQAQILQGLGYTTLGLYTTHGVYSGGAEYLIDYSSVYSTNSFQFGLPVKDGYYINNKLTLRKYNSYLELLNEIPLSL